MTRRGVLTNKPRDAERVAIERTTLDLLRTGPATAHEIIEATGYGMPQVMAAIVHLTALKAVRSATTTIIPAANCTGKQRAKVYEFVKHVDVAVRRWGGGPVRERKPKAPPRRLRSEHARRHRAGADADHTTGAQDRCRAEARGHAVPLAVQGAEARRSDRRDPALPQRGARRAHPRHLLPRRG